MRPRFTIIFDRSAFHGERFELLRDSRLLSLVKAGNLLIHHSPAFLEETISLYKKERNREKLRAQLPFILDICNGGWFLQWEQLWQAEVVQNAGPEANVFEDDWRRRDAESRMRQGALSATPWDELLSGMHLKDAERAKQVRQRELHVEMRHEFAEKLSKATIAKSDKPPSAKTYIETGIEDWAWQIINTHIDNPYKATLNQRWKANKDNCPFFTSFLEGTLYQQWHAMMEPNKEIDLNAQVDIQLLCCLHHADLVVSCDTKFMKDVFTELWLPKGKRMLATDEFVSLLKEQTRT